MKRGVAVRGDKRRGGREKWMRETDKRRVSWRERKANQDPDLDQCSLLI